LGQRRKEVARCSRASCTRQQPARAEQQALPFNISLGAPLGDYPIARAALSILEFASGEIPFEQASRLIRSPFLAGAEPELSMRARLDADLRKRAPARVTLGKLVALIDGAPVLRRRLEALFSLVRSNPALNVRRTNGRGIFPRSSKRRLSRRARPGFRRIPDPGQVQRDARRVRQAGACCARMSFAQALARLRRLCTDTLFQPETPDAPIQVLGVLESAGSSSTHYG